MVYIYVIVLVVLLFLSAVISGAETSFFSLAQADKEYLEEQSQDGNETAARALILEGDSDNFLSVILIANNLVNIAATLVANNILNFLLQGITLSSTLNFIVRIFLVTFILLLSGEIFPKITANKYSLKFVFFSTNIIWAFSKILSPAAYLLLKLGSSVAKRVHVPENTVNRSQLQKAIQITSTESQQDKRILSGIATFSTLEAVEICIPRVDIFALEDNVSYDVVLNSVLDKGYSRIPVYHETLDHIIGILYIKDLLPYLDMSSDFNWRKLLREPYFVPEHKKIDDILTEFRKRKIHIAIVADEYGGLLGLLTMEDILEEILGDITDESDKPEVLYHRISKNVWIFEGKTHIVDFLRIVQLDSNYLDDFKGESDTLAGIMLENKGDFISKSDEVICNGVSFVAEEIDGFKIKKIRAILDL